MLSNILFKQLPKGSYSILCSTPPATHTLQAGLLVQIWRKFLVAEPPSCEEKGPRKSEFFGSGADIPQGEWAKEKWVPWPQSPRGMAALPAKIFFELTEVILLAG